MTSVTIMRNRYVVTWPKHAAGERVYTLPLSRALQRMYTTDAHFVQYTSDLERRLCRESIGRASIQLGVIAFDVDCPDTHGSAEPAPEHWRAALREKVVSLSAACPDPFLYETKGGARIVYQLPQHKCIASAADARDWSRSYALALATLARRFQIAADPACGDWQRLFRLPRVTRDGKATPESWPMHGDPDHIGAFDLSPTQLDVELAAASKPFQPHTELEFTPPSSADGFGLLYHALRARGAIVREHSPSAYVIRCPRESEHSCGRPGDGSTLLYLAARGKEIGSINCLHGHCVGMSVRDWLRLFSDHELTAAREAAGITRAA
jgi:hypothetical protein